MVEVNNRNTHLCALNPLNALNTYSEKESVQLYTDVKQTYKMMPRHTSQA